MVTLSTTGANPVSTGESTPLNVYSSFFTAGTLGSSLTFVNPTMAPQAAPAKVFPSLRRSGRSMIGQISTRYTPEAFCASINDPSHSVQEETLAYHAALDTDYATGDYNGSDSRAYSAMFLMVLMESLENYSRELGISVEILGTLLCVWCAKGRS